MVGWLSQLDADLPSSNEWLSARERRVLSRLFVTPRRNSWRLGRWTAKRAVSAWTNAPISRLEVLAAADGAPEAWLDGTRLSLSVSLSHRRERAVAVVGDAPYQVGCDVELIEPRSAAFVDDWFTPAEQSLVRSHAEGEQALIANLIWSAKEAAAKARREGLRLDVRNATVSMNPQPDSDRPWSPLRIDWRDTSEAAFGWWRVEDGSLITIATTPASRSPRDLTAPDGPPRLSC